MADSHYHTIVIGSGVGSSFFLHRHLQKLRAGDRVLVLERGPNRSWQEQVSTRVNSAIDPLSTYRGAGWEHKTWDFTVGVGGGSNCWSGNVHRILPADFETRRRYGRGVDWPFGYDELVPFYEEAEDIMQVAGEATSAVAPRSRPHPQAPHRMQTPDTVLKKAAPDLVYSFPCARPTKPTAARPNCCGTMICQTCPVNAKFSVLNEMAGIFTPPQVTLLPDAEVLGIEVAGGTARGVEWRTPDGKRHKAAADLVVLGANAIFKPAILLASGLDDGTVGRYLSEQPRWGATVLLKGMSALDGGTQMTSINFALYDGAHRRNHAGCFIESYNYGPLRPDPDRLREIYHINFVFEDEGLADNRVTLVPGEDKPVVHFANYSEYAYKGFEAARRKVEDILAPLPVEEIFFQDTVTRTVSHNLGSTRMGDNPKTSVVNRNQVHHRTGNLVVVGGSVFSTIPAVNPTLSIAALSLRAANAL